MNIKKVDKLAQQWVEAHSHKWSNNNNEVGDNYGSFVEGYKAAEKELPTWDDVKRAINLAQEGCWESIIIQQLKQKK